MNFDQLNQNIETLARHKKVLMGVVLILLISNMALTLGLLVQKQRIILIPPTIKRSFWVEGEEVSPEYLEEMSLFMAHQILDLSPGSAARQKDLVLSYVSSAFYNPLKKRLEEEEAYLKKEQVSTSFKAEHVEVDTKTLSVKIRGTMTHYVASQKIKSMQEEYGLTFGFEGSRLKLQEFKDMT